MNDCIIRGDLANVRVGRHCVVKSRSVIRPPFKKFSKGYVIELSWFSLGQDAGGGGIVLVLSYGLVSMSVLFGALSKSLP